MHSFTKLNKDQILVQKPCEYVGSMKVPFALRGVQREHMINDKLMGMENAQAGLDVVMVITNIGVKTYRKNVIRLAHGISHILFSSFLPTNYLFAYVTKSYCKEQLVICQAHVYKMRLSKDCKELNCKLQEAFDNSKDFDRPDKGFNLNYFASDVDHKKGIERVWTKTEISRGHDVSDHVRRMKDQKNSTSVSRKKEEFKAENMQEKLNDNEVFDLKEYVIIEDEFLVQNEYYCAESLKAVKEYHDTKKSIDVIDEFYAHSGQRLDKTEFDETRNPPWYLSQTTSAHDMVKELSGKLIGFYFVAPHPTRASNYLFCLRVPDNINQNGTLSCTIKRKDSGFYLEGNSSNRFNSITKLVHYYGSLHNTTTKIDQIDSPDNDMECQSVDPEEDYECFESVSFLMTELETIWKK